MKRMLMSDLALPVHSVAMRLGPSSEGAARPQAASSAAGRGGVDLAGKSLLIVEDETFVALELKFTVEDAGGVALGPFYRLKPAMDFFSRREATIDAALLDVNLAGASVFPLARRLAERGVPIVFNTANADMPQIARDFPGAHICMKPVPPQAVLASLRRMLA